MNKFHLLLIRLKHSKRYDFSDGLESMFVTPGIFMYDTLALLLNEDHDG